MFAETTPLPNVWRFHRHRTITLAELICHFYKNYTATEIYYWYCHAPKCIKKREHPAGSKDRRDAAALRFKETGYYGFRD